MRFDWPKIVVGGFVVAGVYATYRMVTSPSLPSRPAPPASHSQRSDTKHLSDAFFRLLHDTAEDLRKKGARVTGSDVMAVLLAESEVKPWSGNRWGYAGLNGMGGAQRRALGFHPVPEAEWKVLSKEQQMHHAEAEWKALSAEQQMPYVRRFLLGNVRDFAKGDGAVLKDVGRLYMLNIMPAYVGKPDDYVVFPKGSEGYKNNAVTDRDQKGYTEVRDMARFVVWATNRDPGYWQELQHRLRAAQEQA